MPLKFQIIRRKNTFLDPFNDFAPKTVTLELRRCPLSGDTARVLPFRVKDLAPVDHQPYVERSQQRPCPFCPDNLPVMAARFPGHVSASGHITQGQAVCFPNAFPYEELSAVIVLTRQHYVTAGEVTAEIIADALEAARACLDKAGAGLGYAAINWNYMMPAGAGLVHPHFQVTAGRAPSRFQARLKARARAFARREGGDIAEAYLTDEERDGSRWLGWVRPFGWAAAFAPRGVYDVLALAPGGRTLGELTRGEVRHLAQGVAKVLGFFQSHHVGAFNMAIHTGLKPESGLPLMARLVSRVDLPPMGVDEINYLEKLHDEQMTFLPPEDQAAALREAW